MKDRGLKAGLLASFEERKVRPGIDGAVAVGDRDDPPALHMLAPGEVD